MRRRREYFAIRQFRRVYDRSRNRFTFNISYETAAKITPRSVAVAEAFGLGLDEEKRFVIYDNVELKIGPTDIVYITGDSIVSESRMFWMKDGQLKFGNMNDLYEDFRTNQVISSFEILSTMDTKVKDSKISWQKIADVSDHGLKEVYDVTVAGGKSIQITKDHSLFYSEGYQIYSIAGSRIRKGKRIVCSAKLDFFDGEEKDIDDYLLILAGLWVADGSYYKTSICISAGNNASILSFLRSIPRVLIKTEQISKLIMLNPRLKNKDIEKQTGESSQTVRNARHRLARYAKRSDKVHVRVTKKGDFIIWNKGLQKKLVALGFSGNCYTKRVPNWLFTASKRQIGLFLKGYFSGDGSFHTKGKNRVVLEAASVNESLLKDVQILLERMGVQSAISTWTSFLGFKTEHPHLKLRIERRKCIENFLCYAGFIYPVKPELISILKKQISVQINDLMTRTVKDVKYVGVKRVFDISVPNSQRFIANGILCHNSGSGKSVLLRALLEDLGPEAVNMATVKVDSEQPLIETVGKTVEEGLELLSRVGLNDAFLFLRTYNQLSDGQRYRYRVAKLIESGKQWWVMDEFCATLDRDTAKIVAFNVQKICRSMGKSLVVATTHMDLFDDLKPSVHIHKRFGKEICVVYYTNEPARECSLMREMRVEEGTMQDWKQLAGFHYRSHRVVAPRKIFCLKRGTEVCGVIVYCYPPPSAYGRRMVLPRMTMRELNEKLAIINRVVVHPKYRSIGLGAKLIRDTLPLIGTAYVEMVAVMAKYNPFAEKAGMKKVTEQEPQREILRVSKVLEQVGFNDQLLGSGNYVFQKLQALNIDDLERVREAFIKADHPRFFKFFSSGLPFGHMGDYEKKVNAATSEQLAGLIKICGFLMQTKVYLFWSREQGY